MVIRTFCSKICHRFGLKQFEGEVVSAVGWNTITAAQRSAEVQSIDSKVLGQPSCQQAYPNETPRQFCTNSTTDANTCTSEPGADILYEGKDTLFLIGMHSLGGCTGPILNTKITALLPWIQTNADTTFCYS